MGKPVSAPAAPRANMRALQARAPVSSKRFWVEREGRPLRGSFPNPELYDLAVARRFWFGSKEQNISGSFPFAFWENMPGRFNAEQYRTRAGEKG
jgi:hypothetical protein